MKSVTESRKVTSFYQLPNKFQYDLLRFVREFPTVDIYLTGSFAKGNWGYHGKFSLVRKLFYLKTKESDLDIVTEPFVGFREDIDVHPFNTVKTLLYKDYTFY